MSEFFKAHLYLTSLIIWLLLYTAGLLLCRKNYLEILLVSFIALPQAYYGLLLVPGYWNPSRIPVLGVGLEDFLFMFLSAGIVWIGVLLFSGKKIIDHFNFRIFFRHIFYLSSVGLFLIIVLYLTGIRGILNPFLTMVCWSIIVLVIRFKFWKIALTGAFSFLIIYSVSLFIGFSLWHDLPSFWTLKNLSGNHFLGIPLEEYVWAFLYGGSWSLAVSFFFNVKLEPSRQEV
jgi:hypothetical protein